MYRTEDKLMFVELTSFKIPDLESRFKLNINVYEINVKHTVTSLNKSRIIFPQECSLPINQNMFSGYLSYISKFKSYDSKFKSRLCTMIFDRKDNSDRVKNTTNLKIPGVFFQI